MDGHPNKKKKLYKGVYYSDTRYHIIKWLEKELPKMKGSVIDIGAGNWKVPKSLLNKTNTKYTTFDRKHYGQSINKVDIYGDIQNMDKGWNDKWDNALCLEVIECVPNPIKAMEEIYRILKPGGTLLLSCPYNYRAFHNGTWENPKQGAPDFWRITANGLNLLASKFSKIDVQGFGGSGPHDRFVHCMKAIK